MNVPAAPSAEYPLAGALALAAVAFVKDSASMVLQVIHHADDLRPLSPSHVFWLRPPRAIERAIAAMVLPRRPGVQLHAYPQKAPAPACPLCLGLKTVDRDELFVSYTAPCPACQPKERA